LKHALGRNADSKEFPCGPKDFPSLFQGISKLFQTFSEAASFDINSLRRKSLVLQGRSRRGPSAIRGSPAGCRARKLLDWTRPGPDERDIPT
jgi:hypothetical protein